MQIRHTEDSHFFPSYWLLDRKLFVLPNADILVGLQFIP